MVKDQMEIKSVRRLKV